MPKVIQPENPAPSPTQSKSKWAFYAVLGVCIAPTIAAFAAYYGMDWQDRSETTNYGELIKAQPAAVLPSATTLDGKPFDLATLGKNWTYVHADSGVCAQACADRLFATRQIRAMTGRERERVERLFIVTDDAPVAPALIAAHPDLTIIRAPAASLGFLPVAAGQSLASTTWLMDPLNRIMMRYADMGNIKTTDPKRVHKDLSKLLYASKSWQGKT